jgi:hypothetical protein
MFLCKVSPLTTRNRQNGRSNGRAVLRRGRMTPTGGWAPHVEVEGQRHSFYFRFECSTSVSPSHLCRPRCSSRRWPSGPCSTNPPPPLAATLHRPVVSTLAPGGGVKWKVSFGIASFACSLRIDTATRPRLERRGAGQIPSTRLAGQGLARYRSRNQLGWRANPYRYVLRLTSCVRG